MKTPDEVARQTLGPDALNGIGYTGYIPYMVAAIETDRRQHTITTALAEALDDREHHVAAAWLRENEDDDAVWGMVGNLLDEIERISEGANR